MDLEQLTKHQIVLLTLLVSFVTSIATGIVTVSLLSQAPPGVTRTINQIVERTVQEVTPPTQGATPVTTVKTVVVQNDDLVAQSIATMQKSIIYIVAKGGTDLIARGIIIDNKGTALTDSAAVIDSPATSFEALLEDGERLAVTIPSGQSTTTPILTIDVAVGTSTGFIPAALADQSQLGLGQSVVRIGGVGNDVVGEGVIASLPNPKSGVIQTTVSSETPGSIVMTLFGEAIGITTSDSLLSGDEYYTLLPQTSTTTTPETNSSSGS